MSFHTKVALIGHLIDIVRTVPYWLPAALAAVVGAVALTWDTNDLETEQGDGE